MEKGLDTKKEKLENRERERVRKYQGESVQSAWLVVLLGLNLDPNELAVVGYP